LFICLIGYNSFFVAYFFDFDYFFLFLTFLNGYKPSFSFSLVFLL